MHPVLFLLQRQYRQTVYHPTDFADTMAIMIRESLPRLNEQTLRGMIRDIEERLELEHNNGNRTIPEQLKAAILEHLSRFGD